MHHNAVRIENLTYTYPDGTNALSGISLSIEAGETVGLVGPNGAGKSTLLLHLNGILTGDGSVNVCGFDVGNGDSAKVRTKVGLVFQDPNDQLFMPTVFDDIAFGPLNMKIPKKDIGKTVENALAEVEMQGFENKFTHHLSFGERKKIAIASVLAMNPEVLALDEPTANLDPRGKRNLIKILNQLNITKVIVTHDLELAKTLCQRIFLLNAGIIVKQGPAEEILSDEALLRSNGL